MSSIPAEQSMPEYTADSIVVLKGLEAVRRRPGMYIGDTKDGSGLHHMVYEVVDNAIDEARAGYGDRVIVTLNADGSVTVEDHGRGIPTKIHPLEGVSAAECIMTRLCANGAYKGLGQGSHKLRRGLHGVGVSVVNALSARLDLTIWRAGKEHAMSFEHGEPLTPLKVVGDALDRSGTRVTFLPSAETFSRTEFDYETLKHHLRELAFFHAGIAIVLTDARGAEPVSEEMAYPGGLKDYVRYLDCRRAPLIREPIESRAVFDEIVVEAAFSWHSGIESDVRAYANCDQKSDGGTHLEGFLAGLAQALGEQVARSGSATPLTGDDVRIGLTGVVAVTIDWPRFDGAAKERLTSPEVYSLVRQTVCQTLRKHLETHPRDVQHIFQQIAAAARKREAGEQLARALRNIV